MSKDLLYGEDFKPGMEFEFGSLTLTESDIISFAREYDPQLMHVSKTAAEASPWGGIIASGVQTVGVYQRLVVDAVWSRTAVKAGRAMNLELRRPVRPGTTLTGKLVVQEVTLRPERGDALMVTRSELTDDAGEVVLVLVLDGVMLMRPTG
ncbi:MAG TPA: MaoC/PaaZ C-terminal domain-containing protein [Sporichthyaceae bacterium]|nr:MaoC/PaaZ C-terminal domain-containing protein [Sporichthyaceae bacterium]